ncbi:hypothetical protein F4860DRAFT_488954 [Xylaria cubensis]|nr:hypothetical protein F4860DRAFT_488954 [Xylaria cubensis]
MCRSFSVLIQMCTSIASLNSHYTRQDHLPYSNNTRIWVTQEGKRVPPLVPFRQNLRMVKKWNKSLPSTNHPSTRYR